MPLLPSGLLWVGTVGFSRAWSAPALCVKWPEFTEFRLIFEVFGGSVNTTFLKSAIQINKK